MGPQGPCRGKGARGQNLVHLQKVVLQIFRSPYLDNHSSESIHTWIIGTLQGCFDSMTLDPGYMLGIGLEVKIKYIFKNSISELNFTRSPYLDSDLSKSIQRVGCRAGFHSMTSDSRVHGWDGARSQNLEHFENVV